MLNAIIRVGNKDVRIAAAAVCLAALAVPFAASAQTTDCQIPPSPLDAPLSDGPMPPVQTAGAIRFMTGGVGADETAAMHTQRTQFSLALTLAERAGAKNGFLSSVLVSIALADGSPVTCMITAGPLLYVDLPPGHYKITATAKNRGTLERKLTIVDGRHLDVSLLWRAPPEVPRIPPSPAASPTPAAPTAPPAPAASPETSPAASAPTVLPPAESVAPAAPMAPVAPE